MRVFLFGFVSFLCLVTLVHAGSKPVVHDMPRGVASPSLLLASADTAMAQSSTITRKPKSGLKAALLSAALPGLGQFYLDEKGRGQVFLIAEGTTWATYAAFQIYSDWKEDDFQRLAKTDAGIDLSDRTDEFADLVGFYNNVDEYNALGRVSDPERPYIDPSDSTSAWYWSDPATRNTFRQLKNSSRESSRRSQFAVGLAIVNRVASVVDALLTARQSIKEEINNQFSFLEDINLRVTLHPDKPERVLRMTWYPGL